MMNAVRSILYVTALGFAVYLGDSFWFILFLVGALLALYWFLLTLYRATGNSLLGALLLLLGLGWLFGGGGDDC